MIGRRLAIALLFAAPLLFASNMLVARATADSIPPVALAFWRWAVAAVLLLPFAARTLWAHRRQAMAEAGDLLVLGALGMGVCGAFVYIGADTTTATNIGLIYAASPILIVLIAWRWHGEHLGPVQGLGVGLSLLGVLAVLSRGDLGVLLGLEFTVGDLWIVAAATGWSVYSILLRYRPSKLPAMARFLAICTAGILVLAPFHLGEALAGEVPTLDRDTVLVVAFLAVFPSFAAYQVYGLIQRSLGAGPTGLLLYLAPVYNAGLAFVLLGEQPHYYHLAGAALVLPGVFLVTRRA